MQTSGRGGEPCSAMNIDTSCASGFPRHAEPRRLRCGTAELGFQALLSDPSCFARMVSLTKIPRAVPSDEGFELAQDTPA